MVRTFVFGFGIAAMLALAVGVRCARDAIVRAAPDEWLLHVRNGRLVASGVGLTVLRWPGDQVVRFTSTVQRVRFEALVTDADLLPVKIEAFTLWVVNPADPLAAFRRLGLGGREGQTHLLAKPQYHAFQQAFAALVLRHAGAFRLADLVRDPAPLLDAVRRDLGPQIEALGGQMLDLQPLSVRPASDAVIAELAAPREQIARREADVARHATALAEEARRRDASDRAQQAEIQAAERKQAAEVAAAERKQHADLAAAQRKQHADLAAADKALAAELDALRRRSEEEARKIRTITSAEAEKPVAVRDAELARLKIESMANSVARLPIKEARWYSIDSPLDAMKRLLNAEA